VAIGDLYQLIDRQEFASQTVLNVYYYRLVSSGGSAPFANDLALAFFETLIPAIIDVQVEGLHHNALEVSCPDDPSDFITLTIVAPDGVGTAGTDGLPPFVAGAIRLNRASRELRNGQKRLAGPPESAQTNGTVTGTYTTSMNVIAALMAGSLTETGHSSVFVPRIVRKQRTPPYAITADIGISSAEFTKLSSQNTRKIGRGV